MFNRRDITAVTCYGLLFAAVVLWAELRPANPDFSVNLSAARQAARTSVGAVPVNLADDQPEIRGFARHMRIP
jgi:hypothetical protein